MEISKKILIMSKIILTYSKFISKLSGVLEKIIIKEEFGYTNKKFSSLELEEKEKVSKILEERLDESEKKLKEITNNPNYITWIVKNIVGGDFIMWEDSEKFKKILEDFDLIKKSSKYKIEKDINKYNNYADLHKELIEKKTDLSYQLTLKKFVPFIKFDDYNVYKLKDYNESLPLLLETGWCVQTESNWRIYRPPYYLITKAGKRYALVHFNSNQCKDIHDEEFESEDVDDGFIETLFQIFISENNKRIITEDDFAPFFSRFYKVAGDNDTKVLMLARADCSQLYELFEEGEDLKIVNSSGKKFYEIGDDFELTEDIFDFFINSLDIIDEKMLDFAIGQYDSNKVLIVLESMTKDDFEKIKQNKKLLNDIDFYIYKTDEYEICNYFLDFDFELRYPKYYLYHLLEEDDFDRFKKLIKILNESDKLWEDYNDYEVLSTASSEIFEYLLEEGYYTLTSFELKNESILYKTDFLKEKIEEDPVSFLNYFYYDDVDELLEIIELLDLNETQHEALMAIVKKKIQKEIANQTMDLPLIFDKGN